MEFAERRRRVLDALGDGVLLLASGNAPAYSRDVEHRFRVDSDFYYLTGMVEPGAVLVLRGGIEAPYRLFVRRRDPEREAWSGPRPGPEGAVAEFGADRADPVDELPTHLPDLLDGAATVHFAPWRNPGLDQAVRRALAELSGKEAQGRRPPQGIAFPGALLGEMRLVKSANEIEAIARAAEITAAGVRAGIARIRPGAFEYQVQASIEHAFREAGAAGPAFPTIVAAGPNACFLHYVANASPIAADDLVLIDAGAEYGLYAGDISRTVPACGRFTPEARALYDVVLAAEEAAIAAVRPGATLHDVHAAAVRALVEGMLELRLLVGTADELIETRAFRRYFMHRTSHWLGLDVHDVGHVHLAGRPRPLQPGMVFTVEPGLYVPADDEAAPPGLRGRGVRIEDDVVVTAEGARVLTRSLPVEPEELATLVGREEA